MYLVSYDIQQDKLRRKIADELKNYGVRVQYSVFLCEISAARFQKMKERLFALASNMENGSIQIYPLCENCMGKVILIGKPIVESQRERNEIIVI